MIYWEIVSIMKTERRQRRRTSVFFVNFGLIPHIAVTYPEIFWEYRFQQGVLEQEPNRT